MFALISSPGKCEGVCAGMWVPLLAGAAGAAAGMVYDWAALSREAAPQVALGYILGPGGRGSGVALAVRF